MTLRARGRDDPLRNSGKLAATPVKRLVGPRLSPAQARNRAGPKQWRRNMFVKTIAAMALAVFLGTTAGAVAQGWQGDNGLYQDRYGLGYTNSARSNPENTNGF
jgi:hypothetical protein